MAAGLQQLAEGDGLEMRTELAVEQVLAAQEGPERLPLHPQRGGARAQPGLGRPRLLHRQRATGGI
ncbi:MAG: hypothetical protein ACYTF3_03080, partial [Planctomycetota bacterium]